MMASTERSLAANLAAVDSDLAVAEAHLLADAIQVLTPEQQETLRAMQAKMQQRATQIVLSDPAVAAVGSSVGASGWNASVNNGRLFISLKPLAERGGVSTQTVVAEILTEARKMAKTVEGKDVVLRVHPEVAKVLKSHQNKYLEELEEVLRRPVLIKSDALLHQEKFDLA